MHETLRKCGASLAPKQPLAIRLDMLTQRLAIASRLLPLHT